MKTKTSQAMEVIKGCGELWGFDNVCQIDFLCPICQGKVQTMLSCFKEEKTDLEELRRYTFKCGFSDDLCDIFEANPKISDLIDDLSSAIKVLEGGEK